MSKHLSRKNGLSRRDILKLAAAAGPGALLVSCAPGATAPPAATEVPAGPTAAPATAAPTAAPQRGTLRLAHYLEWAGRESLDPASPNRFFPPIEMLYNRLVRPHPETLAPSADLAESWEADESAQRWTFHLRQGVVFHDGSPLTSADVAYTIQHVVDPELGSPGASVLEIIDAEAIETPDDLTVVLPLKRPHADFPILLLHYSTYIIKAGSMDTVATTGIGTGPYRLETLEPEATTVLVAHDDYWDGQPALARIEVIAIPGQEARVNALLADQIDYLQLFPLASLDLLSGRNEYRLDMLPTGNFADLVMRTDTAPFDDVRVRQAFKKVVDREAIIRTVLAGNGTPAVDTPVMPLDQYFLPLDKPRDVEGAKALLAEAGYPDGIDVTLVTSDALPGMLALATTYQAQAAEAGIRVELRQHPPDSYWNEVWLIEPFCSSDWSWREADQALNEIFRSGASWNETHWNNPEFDQLLDDARKELDYEKRKALYQAAQQLVSDEGGAIIPYFRNEARALHARVQGIDPQAQGKAINWAFVSVAEG